MREIHSGKSTFYQVQVRFQGKRIAKNFRSKQAALKYRAQIELKKAESLNRVIAPPKEERIIPNAATWLRDRMVLVDRELLAYGTWAQDEQRLRRIILPELTERLGRRTISQITKADVRHILKEQLAQGLSPATHNRILALIRKWLQDNVADEKLAFNPASDIPELREARVRKPDYWNEVEIKKLLVASVRINPCFGVLVNISGDAGSRISENIALQWGDVDYKRERIALHRIIEARTGEIKERTKSTRGGGVRFIPLFPRLRNILEAWFEVTPFKAPSDFIVWNPVTKQGHMTHWIAYNFLEKACRLAEIRYIGFHGLRRSFANMALSAGFSKEELQSMLGHQSVSTTEKYANAIGLRRLNERAKLMGFGEGDNVVPFVAPVKKG